MSHIKKRNDKAEPALVASIPHSNTSNEAIDQSQLGSTFGGSPHKAPHPRLSRKSQRKCKKSLLHSRLASAAFASLSTLKSEIASRPFWLQTHYWHAKRFAMATFWNYRIALQSNSKVYRPLIRAGLSGSTLHDLSYEECFLLQNQPENVNLASILSERTPFKWKVAHQDCHIRYTDQDASMMGHCISCFFVFQETQFLGVVGVESAKGATGTDYLLWVHPSISCTIKDSLLQTCESLIGRLCKFELFGPKSLSLLTELFKLQPVQGIVTVRNSTKKKKVAENFVSGASSNGSPCHSAFTLKEDDASYEIRIIPKSPTRVQLILPASRGVELWRQLIYTNSFIPIGLSERRTLIEQIHLLNPKDTKNLDLVFPFYLPGTPVFSEALARDFETYVLRPESRLPPSKRRVRMPPSELLLHIIQTTTLSQASLFKSESILHQDHVRHASKTHIFSSIAITPIVMSGRGRPCFGSIVYAGKVLTKNASELESIIPPPISWRNDFLGAEENIPEESSIVEDTLENAGEHCKLKSKRPHSFPSEDMISAIGFIVVNPIQERHIASNGFSMVTGSGYGICIYDESLLATAKNLHGQDLCFWVRNPISPALFYPATMVQ